VAYVRILKISDAHFNKLSTWNIED
jgi:hypothetical protein